MVPIEASVEEDAKRGGYMVVGQRSENVCGNRQEPERQILLYRAHCRFKKEVATLGFKGLASNAAATGSAPSGAQPSSAPVRDPSLGASAARGANPTQHDLLTLELTASAMAGHRQAVSKFAERARAGGSQEVRSPRKRTQSLSTGMSIGA